MLVYDRVYWKSMFPFDNLVKVDIFVLMVDNSPIKVDSCHRKVDTNIAIVDIAGLRSIFRPVTDKMVKHYNSFPSQ